MKWLFFLLLLANVGLAVFAYVEHVSPNPDAKLMSLQMNAEEIRIVAEPPPKPRPAPAPTACLEWGTFGELEMRRVREALAPLGLGERVTERRDEVVARWWVYMPPQGSRAAMDRKSDELVRLGITDFELMIDKGRWQYAISLGTFREEEGARAYLAELRGKGVRSADIGRREQNVTQTTVVIRAPTPTESTQLVELGMQFPGGRMVARECTSF